ncbi:hypothetical protein [Synechococcus phage S-B68]|nr:hypothetical protein [Synechococcus phage S-B68]
MATPYAPSTSDLECFADRLGIADDFDAFYESYYFLATDDEDYEAIEEAEAIWSEG